MTLIALDFDGVLCDSAAETAASAWKCARELWPDLLTTELVPCEIVEQFLQVRPWLETGWQSVLMIRMLLEKLPMTAFREELEFHYERLMRKTGLDAASLIRKFAESRDEWIRRDPESWLKSHRFYPGTITALQEALHEHDIYILTTKQPRTKAAGRAGDCIPAGKNPGARNRPAERMPAPGIHQTRSGKHHFC